MSISLLMNFKNIKWLFDVFYCFQGLGNSQKEYEKYIVNFSVKNQLRYKGNLGECTFIFKREFFIELVGSTVMRGTVNLYLELFNYRLLSS